MAWCLCLEGKHVDVRLATKILHIVFVLYSLSPFYGLSPLPLWEFDQRAFTMAAYTLGTAVSRSIAHSKLSKVGRHERVGETRKRGAGREKGKRKGQTPSAALPSPVSSLFLFSCLYRCNFVLSCEHVVLICKPIRSYSLSWYSRHRTGKESPFQFGLRAKFVVSSGWGGCTCMRY